MFFAKKCMLLHKKMQLSVQNLQYAENILINAHFCINLLFLYRKMQKSVLKMQFLTMDRKRKDVTIDSLSGVDFLPQTSGSGAHQVGGWNSGPGTGFRIAIGGGGRATKF